MELGLDHGGSAKLHGALSSMMRHGQVAETPEESVATSDQITIVAVSRNASHAFVVGGATVRPDQEEFWVEEDGLVEAFQEGLSMALMKDVHIPPFMGGGGDDDDMVGTSAGMIVTLELSYVGAVVGAVLVATQPGTSRYGLALACVVSQIRNVGGGRRCRAVCVRRSVLGLLVPYRCHPGR